MNSVLNNYISPSKSKIQMKVFDKELNHYIIPWEGENYEDIDLMYADGVWYIAGGNWLDPKRYKMEIIINE